MGQYPDSEGRIWRLRSVRDEVDRLRLTDPKRYEETMAASMSWKATFKALWKSWRSR
jgi:uncharacterized protein HemX